MILPISKGELAIYNTANNNLNGCSWKDLKISSGYRNANTCRKAIKIKLAKGRNSYHNILMLIF